LPATVAAVAAALATRFLVIMVLAALVVPALVRPAIAADQTEPPATPPAATNPQLVKVSTNVGDFIIELQPDRAPLTVANFLRYVREGYYAGTLIHRVVANFVIQGGGHDATDFKLKPVHEPVVNESGNGLQNKRGTVGLARGELPHSGNAQLYVNLVDNPDLDPLPTRWGYAVFGHVVQGMDVVDRMGVTPTGAMGPFKSDAPLKPIVIQKVELVTSTTNQATPPVATPVVTPSSDTILSPK
jgi:cyclophilin family peptidyl-prolyl cis-trans isomerase